jgi:hypothetical protein
MTIMKYFSKLKNKLFTTLLFFGVLTAFKAQLTYSFTNAGATGQTGPTQTQINTTYASTNLNGSVVCSNGIQSFTVPSSGVYAFTVSGAKSGDYLNTIAPGNGRKISGTYTLTAGSVLQIVVGQMGMAMKNYNSSYISSYASYKTTNAGGGGGSFVYLGSTLLYAAGGGGAPNGYRNALGQDASFSTSGTSGTGGGAGGVSGAGGAAGGSGATAGNNGVGGVGPSSSDGPGGGGGGMGILPSSFLGGSSIYPNGSDGGFGGGGSCAGGNSISGGGGGGGGYSGGGGGGGGAVNNGQGSGGGGGSYGINSITDLGLNNTHGSIVIQRLSGIAISQTSLIACNGASNAALSTTITGAVAPYTYTWFPTGGNGPTTSNMAAGSYTCIATDANLVTYSASFIVTEPSAFTSTLTSQTNLTCNGSGNGQLSVSASGGVPPYTYNWSPTGGSAATATGLSAGGYTCTIRDANNCSSIRTATVTQPAPSSILGFATSPTVCSGQSTILLGAAALTYTWTGGAVNGVSFIPTASTVYTVTGTNGSGCNGTATVAVTVNTPPVLTITGSSIICAGSGATLNVNGANTYTWSNSTNGNVLTANPLTTTTYSVSGTNLNGCIGSASKVVTVLGGLPVVTANASSASICIGGTTTLYGGGAASYAWSSGVTNNTAFSPGITGIYTVTGTNACGSSTNTILITVNSLPTITANASNSAICIGGSAVLTGSGGVSYTWSGGVVNGSTFLPSITNTYTVTGTDANGCKNTASKQIVVNALPNITANVTSSAVCLGNSTTLFGGGGVSYVWTGGVTDNTPFNPTITATYTVTGTDINGCQKTASKAVTVINVPALVVSATSSAVCQGNTTKLLATGALTYTWTNGVTNNVFFTPSSTNTYTVYGTNTCGTTSNVITVTVNPLPIITALASTTAVCIGNTAILSGNGGVSYVWTGGVTNGIAFSPGSTSTYTVTGTNSNGCQNTASKTIVVNSLPAITANTSNSIVCLGNATTLFGAGGVSYIWTGGVTDNVSFSPGTTTTYTVTGTDVNGCQNTASKTVTVINVPALIASASNPAVCLGYSTTLSASGAISYTWTGGIINNVAFAPSATNTYSVYGTNSCGTASNVVTVTVNTLPLVTANANSTVTCIGTPISLFGGGANTYAWSGGITNNVSFIPTVTTSYTVTGTDLNGCQNTAIKTLTVLSLPVVTASASSNAFCYGNSTTLNGSGALTYSWTGGILNNVSFTPTISATYNVTGTDINGCQNTAVKTITVHQIPFVYANVTNSVICTSNSTSFYGSGANTYTWTGGITNGTIMFPTSNGTYTVSGTNTLTGCTSTNLAVASVTVNPLPTITLTASNASVCIGQSVSITASGANTYTFSGGISNGNPFTPNTTTSYFVTGKNTLTGCSNIAQQIITVNPKPFITASVNTNSICEGDSVIFNGSGANSYNWSGGVNNGVPFYPTSSSVYTVSGSNTLTGCSSSNTVSVYITVIPSPTLYISITNPTVCEGNTTAFSVFGANVYTISSGIINGVAFTPTITSTYTIVGLNTANGCKKVQTRTIVVNPKPIINISATPTSVCHGETTTLTGSGADSYTITGGAVNGIAFSPTITATYSISGTNTLTGCTSANAANIAVNVKQLPIVSSTISNSLVCEGSTVIFNASGANTYTWINGPINNVPFIVTQAATYSVVGTDTLTGCTSTNTSIQSVSINPAPDLNLSSSNPGTICIGETTTLTANGIGIFAWNTGKAASYIVVSPTVTTSYTVTLTGTNGCSKTLDITQDVVDCTGLNSYSNNEKNTLLIYPNPSNGTFSIEGISNTQLSITNELGQLLKTLTLNENIKQLVDLQDLPAGIYFVTGNQSNHFVKQKIVITK